MISKFVLFAATALFSLLTCQGYAPDFLKQYPILNNLYIKLYAKSREPKLYSSRIGYVLAGIADKKNQERLNSFLQAVHAYQDQISSQDEVEAELYRDTELLIISIMCIRQTESLYADLIYLLNTCLVSQEYWKQLKDKPFRKFLIRNPFGLKLGQKNELSAEDILQALEGKIRKFTHYLGNLYYQWRQFSSLDNVAQLTEHIQKTIVTLHGCLVHLDPEDFDNLPSQQKAQEWITALTKHWPALAIYRKNTLEDINFLQPVSFFRHYWFDCLAIALATAAATWYGYNNQETLQKTYENVLDAGTNFHQSYIQGPLKTLWNTLYVRKNARPLSDADDTKKQGKIFEEFLQECYEDSQDFFSDDIAALAKQKAEARDISDFTPGFKNDLSKINSYTGLKKLPEMLKYVGLVIMKASLSLNDSLAVVDDLQLIKVLAMNIPVYLSFSITQKIAAFGYKKLTSKHVVYCAIHTLLLKIERILNQCNNHAKGSMNFETQGILLYWLHSLTHYAGKIPAIYKTDFEKDIFEIASPEFETHQKLGTLHRMYRTYPFLTIS